MRLEWDAAGQKYFETGVDHGVLYPMMNGAYANGVAWNGLIGITESPSGAEPTNLYADNIKYLSLMSAEDFGGTINAYTFPDAFGVCDGTAEPIPGVTIAQQARHYFCLAYRTKIGNDADGQDHGYKLHLVYGALASPSEKTRDTINESPSAVEFSWTFTTTPVNVKGFKPTAHLIIDSTKFSPEVMQAIEDVLFGVDESKEDSGVSTQAEGGLVATNARILMPDEVFALIKEAQAENPEDVDQPEGPSEEETAGF